MRIILALILICSHCPATTTELSELDFAGIEQSYGTPKANEDVENGLIIIRGQKFESGVGTHATSSWTLSLDKKATRLHGHVGISDVSERRKGSCEFSIISKDKIIWKSGLVREGDTAKPVDISLIGLDEVTLLVSEASDGGDSDHGNWCCRIEHNGAPLPLRAKPAPALEFIDAGPITNGTTVRAEDYGIIPNSEKDAGPALRALFKKLHAIRDVTVEIAEGNYTLNQQHTIRREWPQSNTDVYALRNYAVVIEGLQGVTLKSTRALFRCTGTFTPLAIVDSKNIKIDGIHIDWVRPTTSQAEVISSDGKSTVIRPHAETPLIVKNNHIYVKNGTSPSAPSTSNWYGDGIWAKMEWDPQTGCPAYQRGDIGGTPTNPVDLGDGTIRVDAPDFKTGNIMILRHDARTHAGVLVHRSQGITILHSYLYASCGLGYLIQHSKDITLIDTHAIPRPGSGRYFSGHDDGFQISGCGGKVLIDGCSFAGLLDDPINVHGTYLDITKRIDDRTLEIRFAHPQSQDQPWADAGDVVTFSNRTTLIRHGDAKVVSWQLNLSKGNGRQLTSPSSGRLTFDQPLPPEIDKGWVVENMTMSPSVEVRNCKFLGNRARGLLVTTPKPVIIENNLFRSSGTAILINGDCNGWFESGAVNDVIIRNNRFEDCLLANYQFCDGIISIIPTNAKVAGPVHRNVRIEANTFVMFDAPVLYARATDGIRFANNQIIRAHNHKPWHYRKAGITLDSCTGVIIENNQAQGEPVSRKIFLGNTLESEVLIKDKVFNK